MFYVYRMEKQQFSIVMGLPSIDEQILISVFDNSYSKEYIVGELERRGVSFDLNDDVYYKVIEGDVKINHLPDIL